MGTSSIEGDELTVEGRKRSGKNKEAKSSILSLFESIVGVARMIPFFLWVWSGIYITSLVGNTYDHFLDSSRRCVWRKVKK